MVHFMHYIAWFSSDASLSNRPMYQTVKSDSKGTKNDRAKM